MSTVHRLVPKGPRKGSGTARVRSKSRRSTKAAQVRRAQIDRSRLVRQGFIDPDGDRSLLAEEMRVVKRSLLAQATIAEGGAKDRVILVTSARPGEGKTFTSVNLALSLAQEQDARVVLIDADATMRGAQTALGIRDDGPGLTELLHGYETSLAGILRPTDVPRLSFIGAGAAGNGNAELYSSRRMAQVVEALLKADERLLVVIDAPPVLATSEAMALAPLAGQTVFVIEAGSTAREAVEQAVELIADLTDVQLVLNKATAGRAHGNYSYFYYADYNKPKTVRKVRKPSWWRRMLGASPLGIGVGIWVSMAAAPVALAGWAVVPRIELATAFTDNVQTEGNGSRDADLVGLIEPGIHVEAEQSRFELLVDYAVQALGYAAHRGESDIRHTLEASSHIEVFDDLVYLDLQGDIGDTLIEDGQPTSVSEFAIVDNRATQIGGTVSPYLQRRLGDWAELEARYRVTHLGYDDDSLADVTANTTSVSVEGIRGVGPMDWVASAIWDKADYDGSGDVEARQSEIILAAVDTSWEVNDRLALLAGAGYSSLDDETRDDGGEAGPYWQVGFEAMPSRDTRIRAQGGQVFGERDISLAGSWRVGANSSLEFTAVDRLSSRFDTVRSEFEARDPLEADVREVVDPAEEVRNRLDQVFIDDTITRLGDALYRQRRADLAFSTKVDRNLFRIAGTLERRKFDGAPGEDSWGVSFGWLRDINRRTDLRLSASWRQVEFFDGSSNDEVNATLGITHRLSSKTTLGFGYALDGSLRDEGRDTLSNTIFVRLRKEF